MEIGTSALTWWTGELVRHNTQVWGTAVQAPEVLLAVPRMWEESLVLTLEICPESKEDGSKSYELNHMRSRMFQGHLFHSSKGRNSAERRNENVNHNLLVTLPLPGSGVVGGSGVVCG